MIGREVPTPGTGAPAPASTVSITTLARSPTLTLTLAPFGCISKRSWVFSPFRLAGRCVARLRSYITTRFDNKTDTPVHHQFFYSHPTFLEVIYVFHV